MAKRYMRLFLLSSFGWGVPWAILMYLMFGLPRRASFLMFLGLGVLGGFLVGACATGAQWLALRTLDKHDRQEAMNVRVTKHVVVGLDYFQAFQKCRTILDEMRLSVSREDVGARVIVGETRASWKSFGEIVSVALDQVGPGQTGVHVSSKPRLWMTLADYGKNFQNVKQLCEALVAPGGPPSARGSGSQ